MSGLLFFFPIPRPEDFDSLGLPIDNISVEKCRGISLRKKKNCGYF